MKTKTITKNARELYSDKLTQLTIEMEVNNAVDLIRSVMIRVRQLLLNDPTNVILLDIKDRFDNAFEFYLDDYDSIINYIDSLNYEKS